MLEKFPALRDSFKMKFFAIFAAALAVSHVSFSAETVKIDGKYYLEDSGGNLIRLPDGAVSEAPKRRPVRSGKYGLPHPSSWHSEPRAEAEAKPEAPSAGAGKDADGESARVPQPPARENCVAYVCSVVEIRGGKRTVLYRFGFSLPESAKAAEGGTLAQGGETLVVFEISRLEN